MRCSWAIFAPIFLCILIRLTIASFNTEKSLTTTCATPCYNGPCIDGKCVCMKGWGGVQCDHCFGRVIVNETNTIIADGPTHYAPKSRCTWIIENEEQTGPLTIRLSNFSTECGWDYLYLYDGNGVFGEQLAALCGTIDNFEIAAPSGSALVYFVSDLAENKQGFTLNYTYDSCPYNCNGNGACSKDGCKCNPGFTGQYCEQEFCTPDVSSGTTCRNGGNCDETSDICLCNSYYHGDYCTTARKYSAWDEVVTTGTSMSGRSSHASVLVDNVIWTVGGEHFSGVDPEMVVTYNITSKKWTTIRVTGDTHPTSRYDHTLVKHKNTLYMFGGVINRKTITSELWSFDLLKRTWTNESNADHDINTVPNAVAGHTAHVINNKMYVFFGYNPHLGFYYKIQIYDFETKKWSQGTENTPVTGRFRHTSVVVDDKVALIYGGSMGGPILGASNLTDSLLEYNFASENWIQRSPSGMSVFLHTATLLNNMMIVVGGNVYNATRSDRCFNEAVIAYDIECKQWYTFENPPPALGRYGHSAVATADNIFVMGGFNGRMLNDVLKFSPALCTQLTRKEDCLSVREGVRCSFTKGVCEPADTQQSVKPDFIAVVKNQPRGNGVSCSAHESSLCEEQRSCISCASQNGCGWCPSGNQCLSSEQECIDGQMMLTAWEKCPADASPTPRSCNLAHDCYSCKLLPHCNWYQVEGKPSCITLSEEALLISEQRARELDRLTSSLLPTRPSFAPVQLPVGTNVSSCPSPCADLNECGSCVTRKQCMWCPSMERCINMEAYTLSFAYGQCQSWVSRNALSDSSSSALQQCQQESSNCKDHKTCTECQLQPACGWIDDLSHTGLGQCVKGNTTGPLDNADVDSSQWFFDTCPECQCNGHSVCTLNSYGLHSNCTKCENHTTGPHCQKCDTGYFGDSRNGGVCQPCQCNGQAYECDDKTGQCFCITKGVIGDHCDRCDTKYIGDPVHGKPCLYELAVDFIFTFKLNDRDVHATEIYLYSTPYKKDTDVTFQISCEGNASQTALVALNLTSNASDGRFGNTKQMMVHTQCDAKGLRRVYLASDPGYTFGTELNTTFYVRVSNFTTPITIQVSFAQSPPINWVLFFVIFAACFIVLLVVAGLLWMIKLRIEVYRRNQNRINEIEHMASRPFSNVRLELTNPYTNMIATPVSIEPCANYKAGVYTLAVRLPTGGRQNTPNGTSGMAVASALCLLTTAQLAVLTAPENTDNRNNRKRTLRSYLPFFRNNNN